MAVKHYWELVFGLAKSWLGGTYRVPAGHDSTKVSSESRSSVESQPSKPKQNGTERNQGNVVWSEV